jgi:hypothetical protein
MAPTPPYHNNLGQNPPFNYQPINDQQINQYHQMAQRNPKASYTLDYRFYQPRNLSNIDNQYLGPMNQGTTPN